LQTWLSSSLKISAHEQVIFLQKLVNNISPVSKTAHQLTKNILLIEQLPNSWNLYGKTGAGYLINDDGSHHPTGQAGWFVGWITKDDRTIIFACYLEDENNQDWLIGKVAKEITKQKLNHYL
jgi:beta-lactamase class D